MCLALTGETVQVVFSDTTIMLEKREDFFN